MMLVKILKRVIVEKGVPAPLVDSVCNALYSLISRDIFKERPSITIFVQVVRVHSYISQRLLLNIMRRFTQQRSLIPTKISFAIAFLIFRRMHLQKNIMRRSFASSKYTTSAFGKKAGGKEAGNIIVSPTFWNNIIHA